MIAAASLAFATEARAASRPHYGGTLRVFRTDAPETLDPATRAASRAPAELSSDLSRLIFETLVELDGRGRPRPGLAASWEAEPGMERWHVHLRPGVHFHDGSPLDAVAVAASLRTSNPAWKILADADSVLIETARAEPELPAELALARHGIVRRAPGRLSGTGPFSIERWEAKKTLTLVANESHWAGRPYLDRIEIRFGDNSQHELTAVDLAQADLIEINPEDIHRAESEGRRIQASGPEELVAIVFHDAPASDADLVGRTRLQASIDRAALSNVVVQAGGEPTGAILPTWMTGYGFLFQPVTGAPPSPPEPGAASSGATRLTLGYPDSDPLMRLIAERILLDARRAAIAIQLTGSDQAQARLLRAQLPSLNPDVALGELARFFELPPPEGADLAPATLYAAEEGLLSTHRLVPLLHLRRAAVLRANVEGWHTLPDGSWQLENVWLSAEKP